MRIYLLDVKPQMYFVIVEKLTEFAISLKLILLCVKQAIFLHFIALQLHF